MKTSRKPTHAPARCESKETTLSTPESAPPARGPSLPIQHIAACGAGCSKARVCADDVRVAAYLKWENAGSPTGDGVQFWLEAEQELNPKV